MKKIFHYFFTILFFLCPLLLAGCRHGDNPYEDYAKEVSEITIPEQVEIVALGEATHGNAEFQQLKLDLLKLLVENGSVRSFALECDFGDAALTNQYIHGGDGTAKEAAAALEFHIYQTSQIEELLQWMHDYNETATADEQLNFYGFDMQSYEASFHFLRDFCIANSIDTTELNRLFDENEDGSLLYTNGERIEILQNTQAALDASAQTDETRFASQCLTCVMQNCELGKIYTTDPAQYNTLRDSYMAQNISWIADTEKALGHPCIYISGHNGHVAKQDNAYENTGSILAKQYNSHYFVIGTDFYRTHCNLPSGNKRTVKSFASKDPLAKMAAASGFSISYLDFTDAMQNETLKELITNPMKMGCLGESYAFYMKLFPQTYRIEATPLDLYDGMIFVTDASPTNISES